MTATMGATSTAAVETASSTTAVKTASATKAMEPTASATAHLRRKERSENRHHRRMDWIDRQACCGHRC